MSERTDWLASRRTGVGGSEVAPILGLSKWRSALDVYLDKRGEGVPQPDNKAMRWGRYLEPAVKQAYADETGRIVRVPEQMLRHPVHKFMVANIDGFTDDHRVFEAKTARYSDGWGEPGSSDIPQPYLLQVQHYMAVTSFEIADVAVLIGGSDFRIYEVPADRELQMLLIDAETEFWDRVQRGDPPDPVSMADVQACWGRASRAEHVQASPQVIEALAALRAARQAIAWHEAAEEAAKVAVLNAMGERDTLVDPSGVVLATWRASKPAMRLDGAALKAALPDIAAQFTTPGEPSRRFLLAKGQS